MNLNKKELKIISYDFNCIANRLLRVPYVEANSVLKKFIDYIDKGSTSKYVLDSLSCQEMVITF
ncbi:hypothetical protein CDLVIII_0162 [Clostridium sp. DL-VIII]|nr:hypothetical protein CDLVIII_0162 [Clostridium sp. DL-VIII]